MYAVVTGAASGIGQQIAIQLSQRGLSLVLCDLDKAGLQNTVEAIETDGAATVLNHMALDVTDFAAVSTWAGHVIEEYGAPAQVFHAAGIAIWGDPRYLPHEKWTTVIDVNLLGTVHMVEAWTPAMADAPRLTRAEARQLDGIPSAVKRILPRRRSRNFLAVSSAAGIIGLPWHAAYSASKGGVLGMCEVLRFDLAPHGVDIHVTVPGAVDTPLVRTVDIHNVDRTKPRVAKLTSLFQGHADSPAEAAAKIIRGVDRGKYLIPTSLEVPLARFAQVLTPPLYRAVMRGLNKGFRWAAE